MKDVKMVGVALFLLLLNISTCWGFGFKHCSQNYPETDVMWCSNQHIVHLSEVVSMIPDNTTRIVLNKNKIRDIPAGTFKKLNRLKSLNLSENELPSLKGGEFTGLVLLSVLNLTYNNISHINSSAFEGLINLKILLLTNNRLAGDLPLLFKPLPAVEEVYLSFNMLKSFSCGASGGSSTLRHLDLFANNIRTLNVSCFPGLNYIQLSNNTDLQLQPDVFVSNPKLRALHLQAVQVEMLVGLSAETKRNLSELSFSLSVDKSPWTICGVLKEMKHLSNVKIDLKGSKLPQGNSSLLDCRTPSKVFIIDANFGNVANVSLGSGRMKILDLINCGLKRISHLTFARQKGLKTLQLNQNNIDIQPDTFRDLTHLTFLSIERNKIRDIDPNWFIPLKNMTCLSMLKNQTTELPPKVFSALTQLEQLYLQFNLLKYITRQPFRNLRRLKRLNLSLNIIDFIEEGTFQDLINLRYLDLSGNRIKRLTPSILSGLSNLIYFVLYNNRLNFRSYESPFINLTSLKYLEMEYQGPGGKGIGSIGPHFFKGLHSLVYFMTGHSIKLNIHPDAFVPLVNLKYLYLAGVVMKETNLTAVLLPLKNLWKLTLFRTDLDTLPKNLLPPNNTLEILKVQANHIRIVEKSMLDALPRLRMLDISKNPLSCTCDNSWFKNWATNNALTQVSYLYTLRCDNDKTSPYLWQFDDKTCSYDHVSFILFITCSLMDALLVAVCLVWHIHGPTLRYLQLIIKTKTGGRKGGSGDKFQYDAFISYSSKDEEWVMRQLVPNLERPASGAPGLRLCLHHRDFRPGAVVLENIELAIYRSRRTICVVTRHYLQSEWCSVEFQLASLRLLCDGSDALLLVFLEEIPDYCLSPFTRLRKIVRRKTYLLWPDQPQEQKAFWVRLIDAVKSINEDEDGGRGGVEEDLVQLIA